MGGTAPNTRCWSTWSPSRVRRLPLGPVDVSRVAIAAGTCEATVRRWIHGIDGHRCQDAAIAAALVRLDLHPARLDPMAAAELPPVAQLVLPAVEQIPSEPGRQPAKRLSRVSPTMGQPGEVRSCPVGLDDSIAPTPTARAGRSAPIRRCRVTILDERGEVVTP